ncbi:hypothetical protein [Paludibacterium purpuratum]|uniref:Nucleoside diphosphate kinase-like domain-containing protein n=1 Tax=Paludibacterium purpuratum TaxID=1144873 RepID=A0A4V3DV91_9NEIS|nr:hypothetical protein [Paludibacterium purpuratum]TDR80069.1 hypothetical protein DFP86_106212 [Paludibacterium purpuratum]
MTLDSLTNHPRKLEIFSTDPYFRDVVDDIAELEITDLSTLKSFVPVIFRPDSLITGHAFDVLAALERDGYRCIWGDRIQYNRYTIRECWKYQLNVATRERIDAMDLLLDGLPAFYALMICNGADSDKRGGLPTLLSKRKGTSSPTTRQPGDLRHSLSRVQESVLTFIHIPDESLDFIREMGIFFPSNVRRKILSLNSAGRFDIKWALRTVFYDSPKHSLAYKDAKREILESLALDDVCHIQNLFSALEDGKINWLKLISDVERLLGPMSRMHKIAIAARFASTHFANAKPVIEDCLV